VVGKFLLEALKCYKDTHIKVLRLYRTNRWTEKRQCIQYRNEGLLLCCLFWSVDPVMLFIVLSLILCLIYWAQASTACLWWSKQFSKSLKVVQGHSESHRRGERVQGFTGYILSA